jgi:hypothetical protein
LAAFCSFSASTTICKEHLVNLIGSIHVVAWLLMP